MTIHNVMRDDLYFTLGSALLKRAFSALFSLWVYTVRQRLTKLPSSSGQDIALSRREQGFDSPRERHLAPLV